MSDLLPREFMARPKMGFTLPFEKWMQGKMRSEISSVFGDEKRLSLVGLNAEAVGKVWRKFLREAEARWGGRGRGRFTCWRNGVRSMALVRQDLQDFQD